MTSGESVHQARRRGTRFGDKLERIDGDILDRLVSARVPAGFSES